MNHSDFKASWLLPVLLAVSGLVITGLGDSAPEAQAESPQAAGETKKVPEETPVREAPRPDKLSLSPSGKISGKGCLTDEAAIEDMQSLRVELEEKAKALAKKESEIQARESALSEELKKIEAVRDEIKAVQQISSGKNEEKINRLAETFEVMAPKSAAAVISNIDQTLAVAALQKISSQKLAKILSAMEPAESGAMTEALAGVVRANRRKKTASRDAAATAPGPNGSAELARKGGENENGNDISQQRQPAGSGPSPATGR